MAFDANLVLKGLYGGALIPIDENDAVAISKTPNSDGNAVVEIDGTGMKGLAAVMLLIGMTSAEAAAFINTDYANITIEASDNLLSGWETVARFHKIFYNTLEFYITATTGFVAADVGQLVTQETTADTGYLISFEDALGTAAGIGKILVQPVDSADVFNEIVGKTVNSAGTGRATKTYGAGTTVRPKQQIPGIHVCRFATEKKYIRCNCEDVADSIGQGWILLTDNAFKTV
jgi:hypothetical protein